MTFESSAVVSANPKTKALLARLHAENTKQEQSFGRKWYQLKFLIFCLWNWGSRETWDQYHDQQCSDLLLSHSKDKCELIYLLACLNSSRNIVECGTSFGVSAIYLALAVSKNVSHRRTDAYGVLTIEKDGRKVAKAKDIWAEAGPEVGGWIQSREGDLLDILAADTGLPEKVDMVFLDAWTSLAFPALMLLLPRLRHGSVVVADKTSTAKILYKDLLDYVRHPKNGFMSVTIPFSEGFEVMVYTPDALIDG